jgi:hypothetical protein
MKHFRIPRCTLETLDEEFLSFAVLPHQCITDPERFVSFLRRSVMANERFQGIDHFKADISTVEDAFGKGEHLMASFFRDRFLLLRSPFFWDLGVAMGTVEKIIRYR